MISKALHRFNPLDYDKTTVIGEFSGRDSVAAILKAFEDDKINYILPVATFAGTEYGDFDAIYDNYLHLKLRVQALFGNRKTLYPLLEYSREDIWALMNGRTANMLQDKFGFYSHCIGCHLYFHLTKLEFAKALSGTIISGERTSHDGRVKVNQLPQSLDTFVKVIGALGCKLIMPLRDIEDGDQVEALIGWDWKEGVAHPACVLSGNYRDGFGVARYDKDGFERLLEEFLYPAGVLIGRYLSDGESDLAALKKEVLSLI